MDHRNQWSSCNNHHLESGWWFGTFYIFPYIGNNHPNWLIFSEGLKPPTSYEWWFIWTYSKHADYHSVNWPEKQICRCFCWQELCGDQNPIFTLFRGWRSRVWNGDGLGLPNELGIHSTRPLYVFNDVEKTCKIMSCHKRTILEW